MQVSNVVVVKLFFLLLLSSFFAFYLSLTYQVENISQVVISLLFGYAVFSILIKRHRCLKLEVKPVAATAGMGLLGYVIFYGITQSEGIFLRALPFLFGTGTALIASGFTQLKQYRRELTILFFLGIPSIFSELFIDISQLTAKATYLLLLYSTFDVYLKGVEIFMSQSAIEVVYDCSGIDQINYLLGLSVLCLILYPLEELKKAICVPLIGITLGFLSNVARVAMMAIFANYDKNAFHYWHTGEGSYVFSMIAVLGLGIIYSLFLKQEDRLVE